MSHIHLQGIHNPEDLSEQDRFRFFVMLEEIYLSIEGYWILQQHAENDERLQRLLHFAAEMKSTAGGALFWEHGQSRSMMPAFRNAIEKLEQPAHTGFSYR